MEGLTKCYIIDKSRLLSFVLNQENLIQKQGSSYFLLIYSVNPQFTKITIYPIDELGIVKYFIQGSIITQDTIKEMINILQPLNPQIIHTSGIVCKAKTYGFEMYFSWIGEKNLAKFQRKILNISGIDSVQEFQVNIL